MTYPQVLSEDETLARAEQGMNLARYGDWELEIACGISRESQRADPKLSHELRAILLNDQKNVLPCIPNVFSETPRRASWLQWAEKPWTDLYRMDRVYGSNFSTRPDSAPWIDRPDYWARVLGLWRDKDAVLVAGTRRSLTVESLVGARSVRAVAAPSHHAYAEIDRIESDIGHANGPVLICLGATATALASRLAAKDIHAIDLGHIGKFMRRGGITPYVMADIASEAWLSSFIHRPGPSTLRGKFPETTDFADFGDALSRRRLPDAAGVLIVDGVLENMEIEKLTEVFGLIHLQARIAACIRIAKNSGTIVRGLSWWARGMKIVGWENIEAAEDDDFIFLILRK